MAIRDDKVVSQGNEERLERRKSVKTAREKLEREQRERERDGNGANGGYGSHSQVSLKQKRTSIGRCSLLPVGSFALWCTHTIRHDPLIGNWSSPAGDNLDTPGKHSDADLIM